ncbi:uncharacterized protein BDZ99DRAFT_440653 [Mytilinidion resinicola]|uniref:Conserved oligomeric Golgi complex subunit 1 n=1 Tax=Mytilinidion resinicola TaxID=574789 RepID=A0A6A6YTN1_9PEZI|nr:uncharacterized protein BDZ99DRAFT_440653 [Mytilinidion resinicola]KAF2811733.1 hypothetical protein BDZ99DRAFT_440653 [Mytilinidion resinicola]
MTNEAPDPRSFKTWEDAFQFPVPVIRKLELQLRANANENREKLRTLVGASYRDLLGTAERIVEMEEHMQQIETTLGKVGQKCNSRAVDRIANNYAELDKQWRARDQDRYAFASQMAVLQSCPNVMTRLLKKKGSSLLIAKILVMSRLLHKSLSQLTSKPPYVDHIRDQLASLRGRLLRRIDKQLSTPTADISMLVENMCAFALATSSTPTDVLRHFHGVRKDAIAESFEHEENVQEFILKALKLCVKTLQDTQAIFPRRLADSLAKLKLQPLMRDPEIRNITELNLDIHERWLSEEARNYTPWPRHDELQRAEAEKLLKAWAKDAISVFLKDTKTALSSVQDLRAVAVLRKELFETWLASGNRVPGLKSSAVLDDLRDVINTQLSTIASKRAGELESVSSAITKIMEQWPADEANTNTSLWNTTTSFLDIGAGAETFKNGILNRSHGRTELVQRVVSAYDTWTDQVLEVKTIIKEMTDIRWDDDIGDDSADSDNEFSLDSKQGLLSDDDPRKIEDAMQEALLKAMVELQKSMGGLITELAADVHDDTITRAMFLIRVLREITDRHPRLALRRLGKESASGPFSSSLIEPLHLMVTNSILRFPLSTYKTRLDKSTSSKVTRGRILWEGNPQLPVQPSPSTFRFLHDLNQEMGRYGGDLWAPGAVRTIKSTGGKQLCELLKASVDIITSQPIPSPTTEKGDTNGTEDASAYTDAKKDKAVQLLFDILYLQRCVGLSDYSIPTDTQFELLLDTLSSAAHLDSVAREKLAKSATDYRKRTYLLFALLS